MSIRNSFQFHAATLTLSVVVVGLCGCGTSSQIVRQDVPSGSISSIVKAEQHGLEVAATTEDQARDEVLASPTVFNVSFEDDVYSWERARFFLENYVGASSGHSSAVTKVVGSRWSLESNPALEAYRYEVLKDSGDAGFTYRVLCVAGGAGNQAQAALNAGNLARFIREGKLEISLLQGARQ